ncbi:MAG: alkylmercury lyase family protein [Alphaproteobacteria bacterium]
MTAPAARRALMAMLDVFGGVGRWAGLSETEDRVRRAVLDHYAQTGHAPSIAQLSRSTAIAPDEVRDLLRKLKARDMVVLDQSGETITGAYPFTERDTGHRVRLGDRVLNAMCAIDALGAGGMYNKDITISSTCPACGRAIHIETRDDGAALATFSPSSAVVWSGIQYFNGCAADSLCTVMAFFCSDEHLESWRNANHPDVKGFRLSMEEGLEAGKAIFTPLLATPAEAA